MKKYKVLICFLLIGSLYNAQNTYIDVTTTLALAMYSNQLENKQEEIIEQQTKLQQAQTWVSTQMIVANKIQDKVLFGLTEVSGTLRNGTQVLGIYKELERCLIHSEKIAIIASHKPQFAVFGVKSTQKAYEEVLKLTAEVGELLKPGELNLMTAGDRYKLLFAINNRVRMLKIWLLSIRLNLERAITLGFWQSINPFQGYINTDKNIVENIMWTYKNRF